MQCALYKITILIAAVSQAYPQSKVETASSVDPSVQVDTIFAKWDHTNSPGCAVAVMQNSQVIYKRGYGMADLDHNIAITPSSVFHIASVSKQFTAAAILLLVGEGKLSLDDDVRKYVPEVPDFGTPITLRDLLHHVSGLRDQLELLGLGGWRIYQDLITDDDVLSLVARQKALNFSPGSRYMYSNTGYTLLAQVVKRVSGKSLREYTSANLFQPLGMEQTHFRDDHAEIVKNIAYGYDLGPDGTFRLSVPNFDSVGATSLLTTVEDLVKWDSNFYQPRVGGPAFTEQMLHHDKLNDGEANDYAFGLMTGSYKGLPIVDHLGADAGYRADLLRFPEQHFSAAVLCNLSATEPRDLTRQIADIYLVKSFKEQPRHDAVQISGEQLSRWTGLFRKSDEDSFLRISLKEGNLWLNTHGILLEMQPASDSRFYLKNSFGSPAELVFAQEGSPAGAKLTVKNEGAKPLVFERVAAFEASEKDLVEYAGSYVSEEIDPVYRVSIEGGQLVMRRPKNPPVKLEPLTRDVFAIGPGTMRFTRTSGNKISGFLLNTDQTKNFKFSKREK
jgi:CubicO group peptidase (beta-lactamase class C family)